MRRLPELNVIPATLKVEGVIKSSLSVAPAVPAAPKTSESPEAGGVSTPLQFPAVDHAADVLPTQVSAPLTT